MEKLAFALSLLISLGLSLPTYAQSLKDRSDAAQDELDMETGGCMTELVAQNGKLTEARTSLQQCLADTAPLKEQIAKLNEEMTDLRVKHAASGAQKGGAEDTEKLQKLRADNEALRLQLSRLENTGIDSSKAAEQYALVSAQLARLQSELESARQQNASLQEQLASASTSVATPAPVSANAPRSKRLKLLRGMATTTRHKKFDPENLIDGDPTTLWSSALRAISGQVMRVSLDGEKTITKVNVTAPQSAQTTSFKKVILNFSDGSSQTLDLSSEYGTHRLSIVPTISDTVEIELLEPREGQKNTFYVKVHEIEVFGY
jgi:predicted  nucleic acid-binding Zn-ribbon protein